MPPDFLSSGSAGLLPLSMIACQASQPALVDIAAGPHGLAHQATARSASLLQRRAEAGRGERLRETVSQVIK